MTYNKQQRLTFLAIGLAFAFTSAMLNIFYRPYIYSNHIYDFHFSDSYSNLCAVPAAQLVVLGFSAKSKLKLHYQIILVCIGFIFYELIGLTFDVYDIIATIMSGFVTYIVERMWFYRYFE